MSNEFKIKVKTGYCENYFLKNGEGLDIISNSDILSYYPVGIELWKESNNDAGNLIATINGYYFDLDYMLDFDVDFVSIFDSINQDIYDLYNILFDNDYYKEDYEVLNPNLFILSNISINECFDNVEYFKLIINSLGDILRYVAKLNVGVIATNINYFDRKRSLKELFFDNEYDVSVDDKDYLVKIFY